MPFLILQSPEAVADALVGGVILVLFPLRVGRDQGVRDVLLQLVQVEIGKHGTNYSPYEVANFFLQGQDP
jgi:hypothetical protein